LKRSGRMEYKWRDGARTRRLEIDDIAPVLARLDRLTPGNVVREARRKTSPLHGWFEWDNTAAARMYRLEQARELIRSVSVTFVGNHHSEPSTVRAFVNLGDGSEYEHVVSVVAVPEKMDRLLAMAKREMDAFIKKYKDFNELAPVIAVMEAVT